jgi:hypothetical protein
MRISLVLPARAGLHFLAMSNRATRVIARSRRDAVFLFSLRVDDGTVVT